MTIGSVPLAALGLAGALALGLLTDAGPVAAQTAVGEAVVVVRDVTGDLGGTVRALAVDNPVHQDELVTTRAESATEITFQDGTHLSLGPDSRLTLDEFVYDPASQTGALAIDLSVGVLRFVSGAMQEDGVVITTPVATIGIRGTIVTIFVALNGTTTLIVEQGAAVVTGAAGGAATVDAAGLSSTVAPGAPPSPPGAPPADAVDAVARMDATLNEGGASGDGETDTAFGDVNPIAPALGAAALIGTILILNDDDGGDEGTAAGTTGGAGTGAGSGG